MRSIRNVLPRVRLAPLLVALASAAALLPARAVLVGDRDGHALLPAQLPALP